MASPSLSAAKSHRLPARTRLATRRSDAVPRLEDATAWGVSVSEAAADDLVWQNCLLSALRSIESPHSGDNTVSQRKISDSGDLPELAPAVNRAQSRPLVAGVLSSTHHLNHCRPPRNSQPPRGQTNVVRPYLACSWPTPVTGALGSIAAPGQFSPCRWPWLSIH